MGAIRAMIFIFKRQVVSLWWIAVLVNIYIIWQTKNKFNYIVFIMPKNNPYTDNSFHASDLKTILHSKRANIYYLQYCRVMQKDGRILYLTEAEKENLYYNIPIANTTCILLGTGTSITQAAMRMLSQAGVLVGFCGGGGTPLFMATEIEWLTPQSEYRPTAYVQGWLSWWWDDAKRLQAAKRIQLARVAFLQNV